MADVARRAARDPARLSVEVTYNHRIKGNDDVTDRSAPGCDLYSATAGGTRRIRSSACRTC